MKNCHFHLVAIAGCSLFGCAPISRQSCINDSAYDISYVAAMDNSERVGNLRDVSKTCGKRGRAIDVNGYLIGFEAGTEAFCGVGNGYRWGLKGRSYNGVCADPAFSAAYGDGRRIYKVEKRRAAIRDRLVDILFRLANIRKLLDEDEMITEERRRELRRKEDSLLLEQRDLLAEQTSLPLG
jgi:hypothetical protein